MSDDSSTTADTFRISRRRVLTVAGVAVGTVMVQAVLPGRADAAPAAPLVLEGMAEDKVEVLSATPPRSIPYPRQLAVRVRDPGQTLLPGTAVEIDFDPHVYVALPQPVVTISGRPVGGSVTASTVDRSTGVMRWTVTLDVPVPQGAELLIVLGTMHPARYPVDLVRAPVGVGTQMPASHRTPARGSRRLSGDAIALPHDGLPWGIELAAWWGHQPWGQRDEFGYYYPTQVTVRSTGPGSVPVPPTVVIDVDPRVVSDLRATFIRLNNKPIPTPVRRTNVIRNANMLRTRWALPITLRAADVVDIGFAAAMLRPAGALPTIKHPVVELGAMGFDLRQRDTGSTSLTRQDSRWQPPTSSGGD